MSGPLATALRDAAAALERHGRRSSCHRDAMAWAASLLRQRAAANDEACDALRPVTVEGPAEHPLRAAFAGIQLAPRHDGAAIVVTLHPDAAYIELRVAVFDREAPHTEWTIASRRRIAVGDFGTESSAARTIALESIRELMHSVACHQVDEDIREADGSRPFEPHPTTKPEAA